MSSRRRKGSMIGSGSKSLEKELIRKAKFLARHPEVLVPRCGGKCLLCPFGSIKKQLMKVAKYADDEEKLVSLSKRGDMMARAYAGTLLIAVRKKVPYTAQIKTPVGTISYVMWGTGSRDKLIGIQYYDNPELRLLAVSDFSKKRGFVIYSTRDEMICTGKKFDPPDEFVEFVMAERGLRMARKPFGWGCPHSTEKTFTGLVIEWASLDREIRICRACAHTRNMNTLHHITGKISAKNVKGDFRVRVEKNLACRTRGCSDCKVGDWDGYGDYLEASIMDDDLITAYEKNHFYSELADRGIYIIGDECYGKDAAAFTEALSPTKVERRVIGAVLRRRKKSIILERPSVSKVLSYGWPRHAKAMISSVVKDRGVIERVLAREFTLAQDAIAHALVLEKERRKLASYPRIKNRSKPVTLLDSAARLYKIGETESIYVLIDSTDHTDMPRLMALKMGIYTAMGKAEAHYWKFPTNESELGRFLGTAVKELFDADEAHYVEKLQAVIDSAALNDVVEAE